jgi:hypothetical protein
MDMYDKVWNMHRVINFISVSPGSDWALEALKDYE